MPGLFDAVANLGIQDPVDSKHPEIVDLYNFWVKGRNAQGKFNFHDFDVFDLPRHLVSKVQLSKVYWAERRFEIRIVGNTLVESTGTNATGLFVDQLPESDASQRRMEFVIDNDLPYAVDSPLTWGAHSFKHCGVGAFPLHDDEGRVAYLLSVVCAYAKDPAQEMNSQFNITCSNLPSEDIAIFDEAFGFWLQTKQEKRLPLKSDIDVTKIPKILPNVLLYRVQEEPLDFSRLVIGETVKNVIRPEHMTTTFRNHPGKGPGSTVWGFFETVYETGVPRYGRLDYDGAEKNVSSVLNLLLPFSEDGVRVSHILNVIHLKKD